MSRCVFGRSCSFFLWLLEGLHIHLHRKAFLRVLSSLACGVGARGFELSATGLYVFVAAFCVLTLSVRCLYLRSIFYLNMLGQYTELCGKSESGILELALRCQHKFPGGYQWLTPRTIAKPSEEVKRRLNRCCTSGCGKQCVSHSSVC
jgi:hypothetical protein